MRKTVAAAAMAASLTVGGAAGAALFVPTISGAQESDDPTTETEETEETERPARGDFLADTLAPLVEDGTIDQGQADAVIEAIQEARPEGFGHHRHGGPGLFGEPLTDILGMGAEELRDALAEGKTIGEIAEENGVEADDVVAALVAVAEEHLAAAVESGHLTEDEAAEKLDDLSEHATDLVEGAFEFGAHREHRGGRFGGASDTTGS